ncbi:YbaB/EbfC family nucleoid-associated protein [Nocardia vaccinii]|uniref:YbaB/EbfC family nucleoid-associated protein n=1 Tax=Nocardia vaccinii TaxID=1822 RepID=UPI000831901E|nr:YbaB/EbfC family nucleoid-associated protein [Nocardia vaccinii]
MTHPVVQAALDAAFEFRQTMFDMFDRIEQTHARRPSPHGLVIPEVDGLGRLTDLYIAPGTIDEFDNDQLAAEIMAAIRESTADAERQHLMVIDGTFAELRSRGTDTVSGK